MFSSFEDARSDSAELSLSLSCSLARSLTHCQHFSSGCSRDNDQTLINWLPGRRAGDQNVEQQQEKGWRGPGHPGHPGCYFIRLYD